MPIRSLFIVRARHPEKRVSEPIYLLTSLETWEKALEGGEQEKIGQYLGLVQTGPYAVEAETGLLRAHTLYRGLRRPLGEEAPEVPNHYGYVISSDVSFTYVRTASAGTLLEEPAPPRSVFMVLVEVPPLGDPRLKLWSDEAGVPIIGSVEDWDWVDADEQEPSQPKGPGGRFVERLWEKPRPRRRPHRRKPS